MEVQMLFQGHRRKWCQCCQCKCNENDTPSYLLSILSYSLSHVILIIMHVKVLLSSPFYRWENRGSEKWTVLPKRHMSLDQSSPNGWETDSMWLIFKTLLLSVLLYVALAPSMQEKKTMQVGATAINRLSGPRRPALASKSCWSPGLILAFFRTGADKQPSRNRGWKSLRVTLHAGLLFHRAGNTPCAQARRSTGPGPNSLGFWQTKTAPFHLSVWPFLHV